METYENDSIPQEIETPEPEIQPQEETPQEEMPQDAAPETPKREKNHTGLGRRLLAAAAAVALVAGSCGITAGLVNNYWEAQTGDLEARFQTQISTLEAQFQTQASDLETQFQTQAGDLEAQFQTQVQQLQTQIDEQAAAAACVPSQVFANTVNSVLHIEATGQTDGDSCCGSGFILTEDGYIVTNYHVVKNSTSLCVTTYNHSYYSAELVGYVESEDIAVLKIDREGLPAVTIGSSDALAVGDQVMTIGNPLGELTHALAVGYISTEPRRITTDSYSGTISMFQLDCAINPGNSGGPLLNMQGEVVGITSAKYSGEDASGTSIEGIGFAVPIDDAISAINDIICSQTGYLGITAGDLDADSAAAYGLSGGADVYDVEEGSGAEAAGIQAGDIIIGLDDTSVGRALDLICALWHYQPGDTALVTVYRDGQQLELTVTLGSRAE